MSYKPEDRFQAELKQLILEAQPGVVMETGVSTEGVSARNILEALDEIGKGELYSVDDFAYPRWEHPRWRLKIGKSSDLLPVISRETGLWDVFLHDSDHGVGCQTFELEFAWGRVKPGGIILCDDTTWGSPPHYAWANFCRRHNVSEIIDLGSVRYFIKKSEIVEDIETSQRNAIVLSNAACMVYGDPLYF